MTLIMISIKNMAVVPVSMELITVFILAFGSVNGLSKANKQLDVIMQNMMILSKAELYSII